MNYKNRWLVACVGPLAAAAAPALAQTDSGGDTLEEVIVTATKTVSTEQKTPISMQVYNGTDLQSRGVVDLQTLATSDPNITFAYTGGGAYVGMRGVSTGNVTETGQPSVAVSTDGIFQSRSYTLNAAMYDIERVEVLRGPQGTLAGRNAVGGLISIYTARPTKDVEGRASLDVGNYGNLDIEGMLNAPLTDSVQVRFAGVSNYHNGYRDNTSTTGLSSDADDENTRSGRVELAFQGGEHFNGLLTGQYSRITNNGLAGRNIPFEAPGAPSHNFPTTLGSPDGWAIDSQNFNDITIKDARWQFDYDALPGGTLITYLGGWESIDYHHANGLPGTESFYQDESPSTISHELRVSAPAGEAVFWQIGAYYFKEKSSLVSALIQDRGSPSEVTNIRFTFPTIPSESKAVFGQGFVNVPGNVKLNAGVRYTKDESSREGTLELIGFSPIAPAILTIPEPGLAKSSKVTWVAGADWNMTESNLFYGKASTGYKAGGFTGAGQYKPESLVSYEIGSKNRFMDDRMQLNLAAYHMTYTDQQLNQFTNPVSGAQTVNADSKIYGLEANFTALAEPIGKIDVGVNYLHTEITGFVPPPGYNPAVSASVIGNKSPLSPTLAATARVSHTWPGVFKGALTGLVAAKYESEKFYSANNFASTRAPGYTTVDAGLDYQPTEANWLVQLYIRNLTDKAVFSDAEEFYAVPPGFYSYSYQPPRTYGLKVTANFK